MKAKKYVIEPDRIIFYPYIIFKVLSIVFGCLILLPFFYFLFFSFKQASDTDISLSISFIYLAFALLFPLLFYIGSQTKVIFDKESKMVMKQSFFITRRLMSFTDIYAIQYVTGTERTFRLFSNKDKFGKGTVLAGVANKEKAEFEKNVLPLLANMTAIQENKPAIAPQEQTKIPAITSYTYYKHEGNIFELKQSNKVWSFVLISIGIAVIALGVNKQDSREMMFFGLIPVVVGISMWLQKKIFDTAASTLTVSYAGIFKQVYPLNTFSQFLIVRRRTNGMYTGTDIRIQFVVNGKTKEANLMSVKKTNHIDALLAETKNILNQSYLKSNQDNLVQAQRQQF